MKEHLRNRYKLYPAPKAVISAEAFKRAVVSRRRAEALLHVQAQAAALDRLQVGAQPSADLGNTDASPALANGDSHPDGSDAVPMDEEPGSMPAKTVTAPAENGGDDTDMAEVGTPQQGRSGHAQPQPAEAQSKHMLKLKHDKAQRKAARQAELEQQWRDAEAERQRKLGEQQRAQAELEADRARQAAELEALRDKLERLKAEKQDLVLQLKQVLATEDMERARAAQRPAMEEGEVLEDGKVSRPGAPAQQQQQQEQQQEGAAPPAPPPPPAAFAFLPPSSPFPVQPLHGSLLLVPPSTMQPPMPPALASLGSGRVAPVQALPRATSGLPLPPHLAALGRTASQPLTPMSLPPHLQGQSSLNSSLVASKGGTG